MRIALCITGKLGGTGKFGSGEPINLDFAYYHYVKHLFDIPGNKVDVYCHYWSDNKNENINRLYKPVREEFEPATITNNLKSRITSINKCLDLVKNNGDGYDFIMISRYDIVLLSDFDFGSIPVGKFVASNWNDRWNRENHEEGFYDLWFISNMNYFRKLLTNIPDSYYNMNAHVFWRELYKERLGNKSDRLFYKYYVGYDYELVKRYYYQNNQEISNEKVKENLEKYIKNYRRKN